MGEIDFENFEVAPERAVEIRSFVEQIKSKKWMQDLRLLINEKGQLREEPTPEGAHPQLLKLEIPKVYEVPENHPCRGLSIRLTGLELRIEFKNELLLEGSFLPKNSGFLVSYIKEENWSQLTTLLEGVQDEIQDAKTLKQQKQSEFLSKFKSKNDQDIVKS